MSASSLASSDAPAANGDPIAACAISRPVPRPSASRPWSEYRSPIGSENTVASNTVKTIAVPIIAQPRPGWPRKT